MDCHFGSLSGKFWKFWFATNIMISDFFEEAYQVSNRSSSYHSIQPQGHSLLIPDSASRPGQTRSNSCQLQNTSTMLWSNKNQNSFEFKNCYFKCKGLWKLKVMSVSRIKRRFVEFINVVMQQGGDLDLEFYTFSSFTIFIRKPGIEKSTKQSVFQVDHFIPAQMY